jgi:hypothetical protein
MHSHFRVFILKGYIVRYEFVTLAVDVKKLELYQRVSGTSMIAVKDPLEYLNWI